MLHKQLVIIAYLTVCRSLWHRIRLYPLDFGVFFYCFVHRVKLKIYSQNTPKYAILPWKCKKNFWGGDTHSHVHVHPRRGASSTTRAFGAPLAPSALHTRARLALQMQFLDPPMYLAKIGLLHRFAPSLCAVEVFLC